MSEPPAGTPSKDRSTAMTLFGVLELLLSLLCLAGLAFMLLSVVMASRLAPGLPPAPAPGGLQMLPTLLVYLLLAVFFAAVGIGSIFPRRWARTLMLIASSLWLLVGVMVILVFVFVLPDFFERVLATEAGPPEVASVAGVLKGCMLAFIALFYAVLPGIFLTFYSGGNVKATFEARDPVPRWTDRCPTPVLALSLLLGYAALSFLLTAGLGVLPAFGRTLTGLPAVLLMLLFAGMLAVLARATYRLEPWSWWAVAAFWLLGAVSTAFLLAGGFDWRALYAQMGVPTEDIEKTGLFERLQSPAMKAIVALWAAGSLAFLLGVRRFFRPPDRPEAPSPLP